MTTYPKIAALKIADGFVGTRDHEGIVVRPKLNKQQQARWDAARNLFCRIITAAVLNRAVLMFDGSVIEPSQIKVTDEGIYVEIENCRFIQFEPKPGWNHGLYDTIPAFEAHVREKFAVMKKLEF